MGGVAASGCPLPPEQPLPPPPTPPPSVAPPSSPPHYSGHAEPRQSAAWPMIIAAGCVSKSSPSGGADVSVWGRTRRRCPGPGGPPCSGSAKEVAPGSRVGGRGGGAGFAVRPPPQSCRAEYASVTAGQTPGDTDQDLHRSEAWLGKRRCLGGVIRAVVAGPPPQAHCRGRGRGEHLARPRRGAGRGARGGVDDGT
jgi:hypothetical protein